MFEVRCLVHDKNLGSVLRALEQLAIEPPVVKPVDESGVGSVNVGMFNKRQDRPAANKKRQGKKHKSYAIKGQNDLTTTVLNHIRNNPNESSLFARQVRGMAIGLGYGSNSYSFALKKLQDDGILTKTANAKVTGEYIINRGKLDG